MNANVTNIKHFSVKEILNSNAPSDEILIKGWVKTKRDSKNFSFIEINDGSSLNNIQVLAEESAADAYNKIKDIATGTSLEIIGSLLESPGKEQKWEIKAKSINILGEAAPEYPLQKKRHTDEFLRTIPHLRPRTNKYGALYRIRSETSYAIHNFFHDRGFLYIHTPIITGSDCEGAGEMFRVTTLPANSDNSEADIFVSDFFGKEANLTVSGQLEAEAFACALGKVYTFGPTFRAEKSNTPRHAAEFWMVEPEVAFADLNDNMNLAEDFTKSITKHVISNCTEDIELFKKFVDKNLETNLKTIVEE